MRLHRIGIDGRSGSGKTRLAAQLAAALPGAVGLLALEDLYPGWRGLTAGVASAARVMKDVAVTGEATYRVWDWHSGGWGERRRLGPASALIVEGVGAGSAAIRPYLDVSIFLTLPDSTRAQRVLERDGRRDERWWKVWARQEEQYLSEEEPECHADVVLRTA